MLTAPALLEGGASDGSGPSARTSERRHGPFREEAPELTRSEEGQGRESGFEMYHTAKFLVHPPPSLAVPNHPVWVSRGGHRRRSSSVPSSGLPTSYPWCRFWTLLHCWGGSGGGGAAEARRAGCLAGHRSAHDLF